MRRFFLPLLLVAALSAGVLAAAPAATAATNDLASVTITGNAGEKPTVAIAKPVAVKSTTSETITKGTGDKAVKGSTVTLDYVFVNGRTGAELETSYGAAAVSLLLDRTKTLPALVDSLIGERVGSRVVIAIAPDDLNAKRATTDAIKKTDTLLFVADVNSVQAPVVPLARATGAPVAPVAGLPAVTLAKNGAPTIAIPKQGEPPAALVVQPLITGTGAVVQAGQTLTVHYTGIVWKTGKVFDSSWKTGSPIDFSIGTKSVIAGWDEGLVGQTVGSQVLLVIPPDKGYGAAGQPKAGIKGTDTLVFVVDILAAT